MAVGFNGSGEYAKYVGSPAFTMTGDTDKFTMAGWANVRDIAPEAWSYFIGIESADSGAQEWGLIGFNYASSQHLAVASGTVPDFDPQFSQDTWYYFYITGENNSGTLTFHAGYYTDVGTSPVDDISDTCSEFDAVRINIANDSYDEWVNCIMAHVRVWTGVILTDSELRAERDSTTAVKTTGLWADWPLADTTDTGDDSGNGHTLSFGGSLTTEDGPLSTASDDLTASEITSGTPTLDAPLFGAIRVNQNFEGTGFDNGETWLTDGGTNGQADPDYSTAPLKGSQSLYMQDDDTVGTYAVTIWENGGGDKEIYGFFRIKFTNWPSTGGTWNAWEFFQTYGGTDGAEPHEMLWINDDRTLQIRHGSLGEFVSGSFTLSLNTEYCIWFHFNRPDSGYGDGWVKIATSASEPGTPDASYSSINITGDTYQESGAAGFTTYHGADYEYVIDQVIISTAPIQLVDHVLSATAITTSVPTLDSPTLGISSVPNAPTGLVAKGGDVAQTKAGAYLQWETPSNPGSAITGYKVQKNVNSGGWVDVTGADSENPDLEYTHATDVEQWCFIDLSSHSNGASVQFRVAATNSSGDSSWSTASTSVNLAQRLYPNSVSSRRILDQDSNSYTVIGDTPWSLVAQSREDIREYFDAFVSAGGNAIICSIPEPWYGPSATTDSDSLHQYNAYGDLPWSGGAAFQLNSSTTTLNEDYWVVADFLIRYAGVLGVSVWVCPAYTGYAVDGYNASNTHISSATNADMTEYGQTLDTRYASDKNILWAPGHDTTPSATVAERFEYLFGVNGRTATFTHHLIWAGGSQTNGPSLVHTWVDNGNFVVGDFDINGVYSYESDTSPVGTIVETVIDDTPSFTGPFMWMEGVYENSVVETETQYRLRGQLWGTVCQGGVGHFGGHCQRWHFDSPQGPTGTAWATSWSENGTVMFLDTYSSIISNLLLTDFHLLLGDFGTQNLITNDGTNRSSARYLADTGALIYVYDTTTLVLDLTVLGTGTVDIWRIDPESGTRSQVGNDVTAVSGYTGLQSQGNNSDSASDWLFEILFTGSASDDLTSSEITSGTPTVATTSALQATFLRPASDVSVGNWTPSTGVTLYATVDEVTPNDPDYMRSENTPSASQAEVGLQSGTDPTESSFHIVRYRYRKSGPGTMNLVFYLMEGATQRATWSHNDVSDTFTTGVYILSGAEADSITNYANLRVRVQATEV